MNLKKITVPLVLLILSLGVSAQQQETFNNPVINADVPDPSIDKGRRYYYLVSTTMHLMPGCPVMRSRDLVHWDDY